MTSTQLARTWHSHALSLLGLIVTSGLVSSPHAAEAQEDALPGYLRDRGPGIPTSLFGTYVKRGQLLVYPFFAYSRDDNREYQPVKLGFGLNQDFRGRFRSSEAQVFVAYGVNDQLALEFNASYTHAALDKAANDPTATPARITESGVSDIEAQVRFRVMQENGRRPELFSFVEMTPASQRHKVLINEPNWDLKPGLGLIRGFGWGTLQLKLTGEWNREARSPDLGEVAIEYLKRLSPSLRLNLAIEGGEGGAPDEFDLVTGVNCRLTDGLALKFDNALGISSKATDWAPEIGLMLRFPH